jgi:hypothetical protein
MKKQTFMTNNEVPERQRFKVLKRVQNSDVIGIKVDGREYKFGQGNSFTVKDAGLAHEIHDTQGQGGTGDVVVVPTQVPPTPGVRRTWTVPALPWHKED